MSNNFLYTQRNYKSIDIWKDITPAQWNDKNWQLQNTIRDVETLSKIIKLNDYQKSEINRVLNKLRSEGKEPMRITPYYASLMESDPFHTKMLPHEKGEKRIDPIFWQSVPTPANLLFPDTGFEAAMAEQERSFGSAYQRYPNRLALFVGENTNCASYCTHCQRAKSLDAECSVTRNEIQKGIFYINYNKNIDEVLVTGGDALMIGLSRLQYVLEQLSKIEHLRVIRIATRVPVVMPMAITNELLELIKTSGNKYSGKNKKYIYFMTHINHWKEITEDLRVAVEKILNAGFTIRNQTVFLKHVNAYFKTLGETFRRMFWIGVQPYYLLQCHKEKGIMHFIAPIQFGKIYMKNLQGWLSSVARPTYAANIEGGGGKVILMPSTHHTMGEVIDVEDGISSSRARIQTWDKRIIEKYEALGRATEQEYQEAVAMMDKFIGRPEVFKPCLIIHDKNGKYIRTTNKSKLPHLSNHRKSLIFDYELFSEDMPLTNPKDIIDELENLYNKSKLNS